MTVQPQYYTPQQPVQPQAPYPQQQVPPQYPVAPQAPQYPVQAPPQQYGQPQFGAPAYGQQPQPPAQPLANGTLDDYFNQPATGGGPGISWKDKPLGTTYAGIVARDISNADVVQDTDYRTQQPKFYRDGRPQFVMRVPLQVAPSQEFPEGEAAFYVRGQARDELQRAMQEAGAEGAPKAGAAISVTLVQRKPSRQGNPANIVAITYTPAGQAGAVATSPAPAPAQPQQQPPAQPVQQYAQPQPQYMQQLPAPQAQPVPPQQQTAQAPAQGTPQPPAGLTPEQQQLLAGMTNGGQPQG